MKHIKIFAFTNFENRAVTVVKEHMAIADAIEQGDSVAVQWLMKEHIGDVKESILVSITNQNNY